MSKELDERIDANRKKLIETANQTIGMGNYRQIKRSYDEIVLEINGIMDDLNEAISEQEAGEGAS